MTAGGIIFAIVMLVLLPVAVMVAGAIWTFVFGWLAVEDAEQRAIADASAGE